MKRCCNIFGLLLIIISMNAQMIIQRGVVYERVGEHEVLVCSPGTYEERVRLYKGHIYIPDTINVDDSAMCVADIGQAFMYCKNLKTIRLPIGLTNIVSLAFVGCTSLQKIEIPKDVTRIYSSAFRECTSLQSVIFPSGLKLIDDSAFEGCIHLTSLDLPASLMQIEDFAFGGCKRIREIYVRSQNPPICCTKRTGLSVFTDIKRTIPVHIPKGTKEVYMNDAEWKYFTNFIDDI